MVEGENEQLAPIEQKANQRQGSQRGQATTSKSAAASPLSDATPKPATTPLPGPEHSLDVLVNSKDLGKVTSLEHSPFNKKLLGSIYNPQEHHDRVRASVTYRLLWIFTGTIFLTFLVLFIDPAAWSNAKDVMQVLLPAETGIIGSAVGFYFGAHSHKT